jgi:hypothetical protein
MGSRRTLSLAALGAALAGIAVLAAGCGGTSTASTGRTAGTTTTTTTTTSLQQGGGFAAFQSCLKSHGVTIARPNRGTGTPPAGGAPPSGGRTGGGAFGQNLTAAQQKAVTACRSKLPNNGRLGQGRPGAGGGTTNPAVAKYTQCLRQHGVTFGSTSQNRTKFQKAQAACRSLLPATPGAGA